MPRKLVAPIVIVLLLEIWGIAIMGNWIGGMATFLLLVGFAALGAWLIKTEGRRVWQQAQRQMQAGEVPGHTMLEGLCVLVGGILLIIPGFLSDIVGLSMIFPLTRPIYRLTMYRWLERLVRSGRFTINRGPNRW